MKNTSKLALPDMEPRGSVPPRWDPLVRLTHWGIAAAIVGNGVISEEGSALHVRRARATIQAASGAMAELMVLRFSEWGLTGAEADVAMLALKGFDTEEIARLRNAAAGTVRAQLARICAKAEVRSRAGLIGLFSEDLMSSQLQPIAPISQPARH